MAIRVLACVCVIALYATAVRAQPTISGRGTTLAEVVLGHAGFVDDATIHHAVLGGALRWHLSPRVSVGPEIVYMRGPGDDRDFMATANVTFDFLSPAPNRVVTPFLVAGAGWFRHSERIGPVPYSSSEGAFTAGLGVRARLSDRWYVGGEARLGWELHTRLNAVVGLRLR